MIQRLSHLITAAGLRESILPYGQESTVPRPLFQHREERKLMENSAQDFAQDYFKTLSQLLSELDRDVIGGKAEAIKIAR